MSLKYLLLITSYFATTLILNSAAYVTNIPDVWIMQSIAPHINNKEKSWHATGDPCGTPIWLHITCNHGYVTGIFLGTIQLNGKGALSTNSIFHDKLTLVIVVDIAVFQNVSGLQQLNTLNLTFTGVTGNVGSLGPDFNQGVMSLLDLSLNPLLKGERTSNT